MTLSIFMHYDKGTREEQKENILGANDQLKKQRQSK